MSGRYCFVRMPSGRVMVGANHCGSWVGDIERRIARDERGKWRLRWVNPDGWAAGSYPTRQAAAHALCRALDKRRRW